MDDRRIQFRVGAVVLATLIIGALLVALNSPGPQTWVPWAKGQYRVTIQLDQAPGVAPNTPVRKNGILIGRVASVEDLDDRVLVTANIDEDIRLYPEYACQVRTSVLGDSSIEFVARRLPPTAEPLDEGGTVQGTVLPNPLDMLANLQGDLSIMTNSLSRAGDEVAALANNFNETFAQGPGQERFVDMLDRAILALDSFSQTMRSVEDLFTDQELRTALKEGMAELPATIRDVRETMRSAVDLLESFDTVIVSAERNLQNLEGFTDPLGRNGEEIINAVNDAVAGVDLLLEEITVFSRTITNSEGAIGQLINDRQLYDNFNALATNANHLIWRINETVKDLRPIVHDVRVFTDKIARNPGRIVGGALQRGPSPK